MSMKQHMNPGNHPWLGRAFQNRGQPATVHENPLVIALMWMSHGLFNWGCNYLPIIFLMIDYYIYIYIWPFLVCFLFLFLFYTPHLQWYFCPFYLIQIYPGAVELMQVIEEFIHIVGLGMKDFHNAYLMTGNLGKNQPTFPPWPHFSIYFCLTWTHNPCALLTPCVNFPTIINLG